MKVVDYIIVGQGLAGSAVAIQLLKLNKKIVVYDDPSDNHSSAIAAGLFNPVTGKKMVKTWNADIIFPYLHNFYGEVEELTQSRFFYRKPIYRPFVSVEEQNEWVVKSGEDVYRSFLKEVFVQSRSPFLNDRYGGLLLDQCGYLDTAEYIQAIGKLIRKEGQFKQEKFFSEEIIFEKPGVLYRDYSAKKIIWCSGIQTNQFFNWLPIRPLKGEIIIINSGLPHDVIVNRGIYIVPGKGEQSWKVGSTYHFHDQTPSSSAEARTELEGKLSELIAIPYEVVDQKWGFRPTTPDRRPVLGQHPEIESMVIFNGLGTKGVSLAPYFSEVLVHWLEKKGSINKEVDIERFKSVYSGSPK